VEAAGHTPDVETAHHVETAHDVEATGHTPDVEAARHDVEAAGRTPGVGHTYAATRALLRRAAARVVCRKYLWRDYPWRDDVNDFNESSAEHAGVTPLLQGAEPRTSASRASVGRRVQLNPTQLNPTQSRSPDTCEFRSR
jgi:hypothetical protein